MKKARKYKKSKGKNLFEEELTVSTLSNMGNPLDKLSQHIDFEMFRPALEDALVNKDRKSNAGCLPFDVVLMFKIFFLQRYYCLSDKQTEYQIADRTSFRNFLGIQTVDDIPSWQTIWHIKDTLRKAGTFETIFATFREYLDALGLSFTEGKIIDASFVEAPKQRNTREENQQIKEGKGDDLWNDKPRKKCHKDIDARYTKKRNETHFGYKLHVKADKKTKLIETMETTDASVHDSNVIETLVEERDKGQELYLDSGYEGREDVVEQCGMKPVICERKHRNHPLTEEQKLSNRTKSKSRCRIEHIFGFIERSMHGSIVRSIGIKRAKGEVALTCLIYNVFRYMQIRKYQPQLLG